MWKRGDKSVGVSQAKGYLIRLGYHLNDSDMNEGVYGPKMEAAVADFQESHGLQETGNIDADTFTLLKKMAEAAPKEGVKHPTNPAYNQARTHIGKGEHDKKFVGWLSTYWKKAGLPGYKTIIGSAFAWCGIFVLAMNSDVGQKYIPGAAGARNWAGYGVEIEYKSDGAPRGAVVRINHNLNCKSAKGNHVGFLDGDCTAEDLTKKGGVVPLLGGNQSDKVKRSIFPNAEICEVRWPTEVEKPGKVTKSVDCGGKTGSESTR
jgi:peptidoglycan hydrolase-like protein with peptidoglycan-binding domain